jgi:nucleotide-binding universal stress UspA family protein
MFERILLPLDGSELAEISLPYAEELASELGSEVILYHVREHEHVQQEHMHQMYLDRLAESVQHNISKARSMGAEAKVTTKVEAGEPTENICNIVDKNKVDLIIMTAVSTSGIKVGKMLGSVVDHVCRTVPIPVLILRPHNIQQASEKERLISRLLIPLDGSELSKLALPVGEDLAANLKASITLFQMANQIRLYNADMYGTSLTFVDYTQFDEEEKARVGKEMSALEIDLKGKGLDVTHVVTSGFDAAGDIIEVSKKVRANLVVMSTHGRSGLTRWVLGNVAEKVLRHGETPLLLVHARAGRSM